MKSMRRLAPAAWEVYRATDTRLKRQANRAWKNGFGTFRPWRSRARGRLEAARQSARYAIELAAGAGRREPAAIFEAAAAVSAVTIRSS